MSDRQDDDFAPHFVEALKTAASVVGNIPVPDGLHPSLKDAHPEYAQGVVAGFRLARSLLQNRLQEFVDRQYPGEHLLEIRDKTLLCKRCKRPVSLDNPGVCG